MARAPGCGSVARKCASVWRMPRASERPMVTPHCGGPSYKSLGRSNYPFSADDYEGEASATVYWTGPAPLEVTAL